MNQDIKKRKNKSLYTRIIGLIIACILVPVFLISIISYYTLSSTINKDFKDVTSKNVDKVFEVIGATDKINRQSVEMLSRDPNAKTIIQNPPNEVWLRRSLNAFRMTHKDILSVYLGTIDERMIILSNHKMVDGYNPTERLWYKEAIQNKGKVIRTNPYKDINNKDLYIVTFAKTVEDSFGKVVGVIGMDMTLDDLNKSIEQTTLGENGFSIVLDSEGTVIAHKQSEKVGITSKENKAIQDILDSKDKIFEKKIDGVNHMVFKQKEEVTGYTVAGLIPKAELTSKIFSAIKFNILVTLIALIVAIFIGCKFTKNTIVNPIKKVVEVLGELTKGNFTAKVEKDKGLCNEIESISFALNNTIDEVVEILRSILKASYQLKENSNSLVSVTEESSAAGVEVAKAIQQISDGSIEQSEKLNEGFDIADKLGEMVEESIEDSNNMVKAAVEVKKASNSGTQIICDLTQVFEENYMANIEVVGTVTSLAEKSNQIGVITDAIKGITEQTNLLALNASIEAARAGDAGRGFAVVAEEVRKLAEESAYSASQIEKVIEEIKNSVSEVAEKLNLSTELNDKTAQCVQGTKKSFMQIQEAIGILEANIEKVSSLLIEVKEDKDLVVANISDASSVAQEAVIISGEVGASSEEQAAGLQEIVSSSENLNKLSEELKELVSKFQI
ncbi:methyl-accepting chemotaxis protein [Clostridium ganghwense]|uniref:Methyl-accepting chemotaxis protein n=1 Tax=Clostridium ganghwense TaxID=312089 RepID=A0ABT4CQF7_9CLOT|nr:methyl-accepting chemotaxis protein [Clostridium ganghwense]MCY6370229.1 methyl-accepting chemotaxis protein [Clostridium ganghwense]